MKNTPILFALLACIGLSCHKSAGRNYHLTATIDGKQQSFNTSLLATQQGTVVSVISIEGKAFANDTFPNIHLVLYTPDSPAIGTYVDTSGPHYTVSCILELNDTTTYASGNGAPGGNNNPMVITITAQDATSVQGTFSGDLYLNNILVGKEAITGDFDVPWKK